VKISNEVAKKKERKRKDKEEKDRHSNDIIQKYKDNVRNFDVSALIPGMIFQIY
jgi:hypothetical protein